MLILEPYSLCWQAVRHNTYKFDYMYSHYIHLNYIHVICISSNFTVTVFKEATALLQHHQCISVK